MASRKLIWQVLPAYGLTVAAALGLLLWFTQYTARRFYEQEARESLAAQAGLLSERLEPHMTPPDPSAITGICQSMEEHLPNGFSVSLPDGSSFHGRRLQNEGPDAGRLGLEDALAGREHSAVAVAPGRRVRMVYAAAPVRVNTGAVVGAVNVRMPYIRIEDSMRSLRDKIAIGAAVILGLALCIGLVLVRSMAGPLEDMRRASEHYAAGEFGYKIPGYRIAEFNTLSSALNAMARRMSGTLENMGRQQSEQRAMLASMTEGVVAIDTEERVLNMNNAAARLLGIQEEQTRGRSIQEVVRHAALQEFMISSLEVTDAPQEKHIVLYDRQVRYLLARASGLRDGTGHIIGALVVLHDVTEVQRLERIRRDFVANVSHELKTPITSIKGFVETLLEGERVNPEEMRRFLEIIAKQTDRLDAIINDLLLLSRMEQDRERDTIAVQDENIRNIIEGAVQVCAKNAADKRIRVETFCDINLVAPVNAHLLEQALINLIDNAVKYSDEGKSVRVEAEQGDREVCVRVIDQGCGIEKKDIPRLFERFYRVDKARSRKLGGTGLGLAIVKHISQAHGGRVAVESTPGKGSIFLIAIPSTRDYIFNSTQTMLALKESNGQ